MTDSQTLNILIGVVFMILIGILRHNRGMGWG